MNRLMRIVAPLLILVVGAGVAAALISRRAAPEPSTPDVVLPEVRVVDVTLDKLRVDVQSQGTVVPRTESRLAAEVGGRVVSISPKLASGGFFEKGELLLAIDPVDFEQARTQAEAQVVQAELRLEQERAERQIALDEWRELGSGETPSPLTSRDLQVRGAEANLEASRASLRRAERDLERTRIVAPYAGIVREKAVDLGQFVARGQFLVALYAIDYAEIRLPLPDDDLAFLDLPLAYRGGGGTRGPQVTLSADFAGQRWDWQGRIVRTEGAIDANSRMVHAVARVDDPYRRVGERPPLAAGLFVEATIDGAEFDAIAAVPRAAIREDGRVLIVDGEDRLRFRTIDVLRLERDRALVRGGLEPGDRLCISPLAVAVDGMQVRVAGGAA